MMLIDGKVALVTGGANGIGAETAFVFAKNGAKSIYIADMADDCGRETEQRLRELCKCTYIHADVSKELSAQMVLEKILSQEKSLDILFNCAGISSTKGIFETDEPLWDKIMAVNARGTFYFSRIAIPKMIEQQYGKIINVSSIAGQVGGIRTCPAYAASKAAILSITKSFAKLGAAHGVTVNTIAPGIADTNMTRDKDFHYSNEEVPMGRAATPEEVANVVLFLASDLSSYVTGQCVNVNGGMYFS
jgi:3-oxoacyl-[acyl-carrier protein] reductase